MSFSGWSSCQRRARSGLAITGRPTTTSWPSKKSTRLPNRQAVFPRMTFGKANSCGFEGKFAVPLREHHRYFICRCAKKIPAILVGKKGLRTDPGLVRPDIALSGGYRRIAKPVHMPYPCGGGHMVPWDNKGTGRHSRCRRIEYHKHKPFILGERWLLGLQTKGPRPSWTLGLDSLDLNLDLASRSFRMDCENIGPLESVPGECCGPVVPCQHRTHPVFPCAFAHLGVCHGPEHTERRPRPP